MVDANGFLRGGGGGGNTVDLFRIDCQRLFHQHVASALERRNRQLCVSVGGSQNMHYVNSLFHHSFHRVKYFRDVEPSSQSRSTNVDNVGNSHYPRVRHTLERVG